MALLKIQRRWDPTLVFLVSGRLDAENVVELCKLIDAEPANTVVVLDLTDLVLADRDVVRYLRDYETADRIVLRNCPAYIPRLDGRRGKSLSDGLQNIDCG